MFAPLLYLRSDIQVEPLINRWYAWAQLVPPAPAAFNIVGRHLKTMGSYLQSPDLHAAAVANPKMRGGPFIDLDGHKVEEIRVLLEETRKRAAHQIAFTEAVRVLDDLLKTKADGHTLQPLYAEIPEPLKGQVELFYNRGHRADFRLFEPLLYKSPVYDESFQSVALSVIGEDCSRPFLFSTPRLDDPGVLHLPVPFASPGLDTLFRAKREPQALAIVRRSLGIPLGPEEDALLQGFFTETPPPTYQPYSGDRLRIRYFGHACILIEAQGTSILIDPVLSYTYESDISRFTYDDLPDKIDYVLITHGHHDHILLETMLQIRHRVRNVIVPRNCSGMLQDPSLKLMLERLGFNGVRNLDEFETVAIADGLITGFPFMGEHHDLQIQSKLTYHIRYRDKSVMVMADSCNIAPELYERVHHITGNVDILFLGMECDGAPVSWVYGPLFTDKPDRERDHSRRGRGSNCAEGMDLVRRFNCKEVYVYAMGEEPWVQYILGMHYTAQSNAIVQSNMLVAECRQEGRLSERLFGEKEIG